MKQKILFRVEKFGGKTVIVPADDRSLVSIVRKMLRNKKV